MTVSKPISLFAISTFLLVIASGSAYAEYYVNSLPESGFPACSTCNSNPVVYQETEFVPDIVEPKYQYKRHHHRHVHHKHHRHHCGYVPRHIPRHPCNNYSITVYHPNPCLYDEVGEMRGSYETYSSGRFVRHAVSRTCDRVYTSQYESFGEIYMGND